MTTVSSDQRIVISREELQDPAIDERLAHQRTAGPAALQPIEEASFFDHLYSARFYLMLAGLCGAVLAWAVIEPYFEDGIRFTGRIEEVTREDLRPGIRRIKVSGINVFVVSSATAIRGAGNPQVGYTVDDLRSDAIVTVVGEALPEANGLAAGAIRIDAADTAVPPPVTLSALQSGNVASRFLLFPLVGAFVGLAVGAVEGLVCRTLVRALRCGAYGLMAGLVGGAVSAIVGGLVYQGLGQVGGASFDTLPAFLVQMFRRGLAWTIVGTAMGLGQGLALKNRTLLLNGFIGGLLGGLVGGLLFDPINLLVANRTQMAGAEASRAIGLGIIGAVVGLFIGITDMLTRVAWLRVTAGPLRGKEFSFTQTPIRLGSSPKNEIYLFKDQKIDPVHAVIDKLRDTYELTDNGSGSGTFVNRQRVRRVRLNDGDLIAIGDSEFVYTMRDRKRA